MKKQRLYRLCLTLLLLVFAQGAALAQVSRVVDGGVVYEPDSDPDDWDWTITGIVPDDPSFPADGIITLKSSIEVDVFGDGNKEDVFVTEITNRAFNNQNAIKGVTIEEGIEVIGEEAFNGCANLTGLVLPSTIENVGRNAFGWLRWVDCRNVKEENWSQDLLAPYDVMSPEDLGDYNLTLYYMPSWCNKDNYNYTNAVLTDGEGNLTCPEFNFSRNMDYCVPYAFTAYKVTIDPEFEQDPYAYSVCLPFSMPVPTDAKVYELRQNDNLDVYFGLISGDMAAYTPYLIVAETGYVEVCFERETLIPTTEDAASKLSSKTVSDVTIHGTFKRINNEEAAGNKYYVLQNENKWKLVGPNTAVGVPPFRTYLTLSGSQPANFQIGFEDATEGIHLTEITEDHHGADAWYTLHGQRLSSSPSTSGIYIHGDKKTMVR